MLQEIHSPASLGLALTAALLLMTWRAFFTRVSSVPGPLAARFSDLWYAHRVFRGEFEKDNIELHRKYGMFTPDGALLEMALWPLLTLGG